MRLWHKLVLLSLFSLIVSVAATSAHPQQRQPTPPAGCDLQVQAILEQVSQLCAATGRNEVCYGNDRLRAAFRPDVSPVPFGSAGDTAALSLLASIGTEPYRPQQGTWGVALIKAQVDLPTALPGQNVTFLLYGGSSLENVSPGMQAVTLRTGFGGVECEALPTSALLIQAPEGERVQMTINGADITLGSTARITAGKQQTMRISTLEGEVVVEAFGVERVIPPGAEVGIALGGEDGLTVEEEPGEVVPYDDSEFDELPIELLEREIEIIEPIEEDELADFLESIDDEDTDDGAGDEESTDDDDPTDDPNPDDGAPDAPTDDGSTDDDDTTDDDPPPADDPGSDDSGDTGGADDGGDDGSGNTDGG